MLLMLALSVLSAGGYRQQAGSGKAELKQLEPTKQEERPGGRESRASIKRQHQEKVVRDAYVRLMRYQTAGVDEQSATSGVSTKPEDYVIFELREMHSGPIEEIEGRAIAELVTGASGEVVKVTPHHLRHGNGPRHAYYDVEWSQAAPKAEAKQATVAEMLASGGDRLADVEGYTSYEVRVRLAGKARSYRAIALHHSMSKHATYANRTPDF